MFFDDFTGKKSISKEGKKKRAKDAALLFKKGLVKEIICVGGYMEDRPVIGSMLVASYLQSIGVPLDNILVDRESFSTKRNIKSINKIAKDFGYNSFVFVSAPMHLLRIRALFDAPVQTYSSIRLGQIDAYKLIVSAHHELGSWVVNYLLPRELEKKLVWYTRNRL